MSEKIANNRQQAKAANLFPACSDKLYKIIMIILFFAKVSGFNKIYNTYC